MSVFLSLRKKMLSQVCSSDFCVYLHRERQMLIIEVCTYFPLVTHVDIKCEQPHGHIPYMSYRIIIYTDLVQVCPCFTKWEQYIQIRAAVGGCQINRLVGLGKTDKNIHDNKEEEESSLTGLSIALGYTAEDNDLWLSHSLLPTTHLLRITC